MTKKKVGARRHVRRRAFGEPGFACVSPKGKPKVDTVSVDRESAQFFCDGDLMEKGFKVRRVRVMLERQGRKWG